jgi:hypothetical protein
LKLHDAIKELAMKSTYRSAALGAAVVVALAAVTPAQSAPLNSDPTLARPALAGVEQVRWRGHRHHHGHGGWHGDHRYGWGPLAGGLAAGAIIGGAIASSQARADAVDYCSQRYKSYDPASGTYLGYDGQRHPCP